MNAPAPTLLTPEAYMDLLVARQDAYLVENPPAKPWLLPLLEWFIAPGDEDLVDMDAIEASNARTTDAPRPERKPRVYRSAASLRTERDKVAAQRDAALPAGLPDRAAATGQGIGRKRGMAYAASMDRALERYTRLDKRVRALDQRVASAEARERRAAS